MDDLTKLGLQYHTDKAYFHNYTPFYNTYFKNIRYNKINILEIGMLYGSSLKMFKDYFPNAEIYCIDINADLINKFPKEDRIHIHLCDATDEEKLNKLFENIEFDIIIDDGSHQTIHQLLSLGILFKKVKPQGMYVCEDLLYIEALRHQNALNSKTIPLEIFEKYNVTKNLNIEDISKEKNEYINVNIKDIKVYKRDVNAYQCHFCGLINNYIHSKCVRCGTNLGFTDISTGMSCTSILFKK